MLIAIVVSAISAVTDLRTGYVFDRVLLPAGILLGMLTILSGDVASAAGGMAVAASAPAALYITTRGRGMGFGDVKLATLLGAATDARGALEMLTVSFISGGVVAIVLLAVGRRRSDAIPFAPFLCLGMCAIWMEATIR